MFYYPWHIWLAFFYIYCFLGWCFESSYVSIKEHRLVNRGFLRGPAIPIYGFGAVTMLFVSYPYKDALLACFISGMIGATTLEYFTGSVMEQLFKVRYWDYSDQKFNYNGYICLSSSIVWGLFTILLDHVFHHFVLNLLSPFSDNAITIIVIIATAVFSFDAINSVRAALSLASALEAMHKVRKNLEEVQLQLSLIASEASDYSAKHMGNIRSTAAKASKERLVLLSELKSGIEARLSQLKASYPGKESYNAIAEKLKAISLPQFKSTKLVTAFKKGLLRGNPHATSKYSEALRELQKRISR